MADNFQNSNFRTSADKTQAAGVPSKLAPTSTIVGVTGYPWEGSNDISGYVPDTLWSSPNNPALTPGVYLFEDSTLNNVTSSTTFFYNGYRYSLSSGKIISVSLI